MEVGLPCHSWASSLPTLRTRGFRLCFEIFQKFSQDKVFYTLFKTQRWVTLILLVLRLIRDPTIQLYLGAEYLNWCTNSVSRQRCLVLLVMDACCPVRLLQALRLSDHKLREIVTFECSVLRADWWYQTSCECGTPDTSSVIHVTTRCHLATTITMS